MSAEAPADGSSNGVSSSSSADAIKIIFLDVGTLRTPSHSHGAPEANSEPHLDCASAPRADGVICCNGMGRLEEDKLSRLRKVAHETGAKVVLSTDWRRDLSLKATITGALTDRGMSVIGATRKGPPLKPIRPQEITGWLDGFLGKPNHAVSQWVAVDDRELIGEIGGERLKGHFVNTSFASGLSDRVAERMVAVLNGDHDQGMGHFAARTVENRRAGGRGRSPSPGRRGRSGAPSAASAPSMAATSPARTGGFAAATAPGGAHSSLAAADGPPTPSRAMAATMTPGGRLGREGGGRRTPAGQSPASSAARNAAFGRSKPGLVSPTCARVYDASAPGAAPAAPAAAAPAPRTPGSGGSGSRRGSRSATPTKNSEGRAPSAAKEGPKEGVV